MAETYSRQIAGKRVTCSADPVLAPQVEALFNVIEAAPAEFIHDGFVMRAGWSAFKLVVGIDADAGARALVVHCPDFAGDLRDWVSNITIALAVEAEQSALSRLVAIDNAVPAVFTQRVVCAEGVLESHALVAHHAASGDDRDSGWFLGYPGEEPDERKLTALSVGQLVRTRASILKVLALPHGYLAAFDGDEIELILDADDEPVYERAAQGADS